MKAALTALALITAPAWAGDEWTRLDTGLAATGGVLLALDWAQTRYIARHPDLYYEKGPARSFIGKHPSVGDVDKYFAATFVVQAATVYLLPPKYRGAYMLLFIGYEANYVINNYRIGIKTDF